MSSPPGRCRLAIVLVVVALAVLTLFTQAARADKKKAADPAPAAAGGGTKQKNHTFTGLDIDGKLKTPQLLYFLNRMKSEFDTTTPDKRSFIPELKRSADEM